MQWIISAAALLSFISCVCCEPIDFYSYGPGHGDSHLANSANPAATLDLLEPYTFYGEEYDKICVSGINFERACTIELTLLNIFPHSYRTMATSHFSTLSPPTSQNHSQSKSAWKLPRELG